MNRLLLFLGLALVATCVRAQRPMTWDEFVEYLTDHEELTGGITGEEETGNGGDSWEDFLEGLHEVHLSPLDINKATKDELLALPLLSEMQVMQIIQYRDRYRGMRTLAELMALTSVSYYERRYLPLFLYAGELPPARFEGGWYREDAPSDSLADSMQVRSVWRYRPGYPDKERLFWQNPQHEFLSRVDVPFYHRRGYLVENGYLGQPIYNKVYYRLKASRHLTVSLRMERDAGEKGIDSYGGHAMLTDIRLFDRQDVVLKKLVVGDFKASFGQGLVMNQGFVMGKTTAYLRRSQGFRPHQSTDEQNFMRGVGLTMGLGNMELSLFYSHRSWDGTPNTATSGHPETIRTLVKDGYHRTETERSKKGLVGVDVVGGNASWRKGGYHVGGTGYFLHTSKELLPGSSLYRQIYPQGCHFASAGVDYGYTGYRWTFWGEAALGGTFSRFPGDIQLASGQDPLRHGGAVMNGVSWRPSQRYTLSALQRYYNRNYWSFLGNALSENGNVQNETGGMLRMDAHPFDGVDLSAYVDVFYNPWPRYGLTHSSYGWEGTVDGLCEVTRHHAMKVRYSVKRKEQSSGVAVHHKLRLQWVATMASERLRLTTTAMIHALKGSYGEAIGESLKWGRTYGALRQKSLKLSVGGLYFHTTDYNSRIYLYEPNVSGMMYVPSFSGHGLRGTCVAQCQLWRQRIGLEMKYGATRYFDRKVQGSGMQTIYSNVKNDLSLQVKLKI